ncbi:hypothetical protein OQZ29_08850 [Pedobacter agri]|uniref:Uncharacterized protein n=2 Tax=Pedobacter agri TaxID=454586 RepID=A0A9X3I922_9SPHI|nr:DUF6624 domain-containing protein [Pedobacter agri]MCX3264850.1 hypothetical protein [Pedobacter agri]
MKTLLFALLILFAINSGMYAQKLQYFQHLNNALQLYQDKRYADAGKAFDLAIAELGGVTTQTNFYNAACAWSLADERDKSFFYLQKILNGKMIKGWDDPVEFYDMLIKDVDFKNIKSDKRWVTTVKKAERKKDNFLKRLDKGIAIRIERMGEADQDIRTKLDSLRKKDGLNSSAERKIIKVMRQQDSTNFAAFEEIIKKFGWLGPEEIGYKNNQYLFLILQHADLENQQKYLPLFRKSFQAGKVLPKDLAYLEDRINMRLKKMQQYGSQTIINNISKKYVLYPVDDVDGVDHRRAMVGLESLKSYMKSSFNIDFDIEQYKRELPKLIELYIDQKNN